MSFKYIHFNEVSDSPPIYGEWLQPNELIAFPQVWGYIFPPMESSFSGEKNEPKGPLFLIG